MTHNLVVLASGAALVGAVLREAWSLWLAKRSKSSVVISTRHGQIDITNLDSATANRIVTEALKDKDGYKVDPEGPKVGRHGD